MKRIPGLFTMVAALALTTACNQTTTNTTTSVPATETTDTALARQQISAMLDSFNAAAARADYEGYFSFYTDDAVFIGTDAAEHWDKQAFKEWAKPQFDRKTAWDFKAFDRHIYMGKHGDIAWMDELLVTAFAGIARGSGVIVKQGDEWKVQQYVLSMTVPNNIAEAVRLMKTPVDDSIQAAAGGQK